MIVREVDSESVASDSYMHMRRDDLVLFFLICSSQGMSPQNGTIINCMCERDRQDETVVAATSMLVRIYVFLIQIFTEFVPCIHDNDVCI